MEGATFKQQFVCKIYCVNVCNTKVSALLSKFQNQSLMNQSHSWKTILDFMTRVDLIWNIINIIILKILIKTILMRGLPLGRDICVTLWSRPSSSRSVTHDRIVSWQGDVCDTSSVQPMVTPNWPMSHCQLPSLSSSSSLPSSPGLFSYSVWNL